MTDAGVKKLREEASEQVAVWVLLRKADADKYGGLIKNLKSLRVLQDDKFPKNKRESCGSSPKLFLGRRMARKEEEKTTGKDFSQVSTHLFAGVCTPAI